MNGNLSPAVLKLAHDGLQYPQQYQEQQESQPYTPEVDLSLCHYFLVAKGKVLQFLGEEKVIENENCAVCDGHSCPRVYISERDYQKNARNAPFLDQIVQLDEQLAAFKSLSAKTFNQKS